MSTDPVTAGVIWFQQSPDAPNRGHGPQPGTLAVADIIWRLLEEPRTFPELVSILTESAWDEADRIPGNVNIALAELIGRGVVQAVADGDD